MIAVGDILDRIVQPEIDHDPESEGYGTFGVSLPSLLSWHPQLTRPRGNRARKSSMPPSGEPSNLAKMSGENMTSMHILESSWR